MLAFFMLSCSFGPTQPSQDWKPDTVPWNLEMINVEPSWDISGGGHNITVAIIGWGVDPHHPRLENRITHSWDYVTGQQEVEDPTGHDTFAAGIVLSVAPRASLMTFRLMDQQGKEVGKIDQAIRAAADHRAEVILLPMAVTEPQPTADYIDRVQASIVYAYAQGVRFIIGAQGRGRHHGYRFPGYLQGIYNAAGVDRQGFYSLNSTANDRNFIAAPCEDIPGIDTPGDWQNVGGTSWSSAHLAGVAALMLSANPYLNNADIKTILMETAQPKGLFEKDIYYGHGLVDCYASVRASRGLLFCRLQESLLDHLAGPSPNDMALIFGP